jgi:hypothetical protein
MKIYIGITLPIHRYVCYRRTHGRKQSIEKTLVDNLWIIGGSIRKKYIDGFTNRQSTPKIKFTRFILLVYPSVNITYLR